MGVDCVMLLSKITKLGELFKTFLWAHCSKKKFNTISKLSSFQYVHMTCCFTYNSPLSQHITHEWHDQEPNSEGGSLTLPALGEGWYNTLPLAPTSCGLHHWVLWGDLPEYIRLLLLRNGGSVDGAQWETMVSRYLTNTNSRFKIKMS